MAHAGVIISYQHTPWLVTSDEAFEISTQQSAAIPGLDYEYFGVDEGVFVPISGQFEFSVLEEDTGLPIIALTSAENIGGVAIGAHAWSTAQLIAHIIRADPSEWKVTGDLSRARLVHAVCTKIIEDGTWTVDGACDPDGYLDTLETLLGRTDHTQRIGFISRLAQSILNCVRVALNAGDLKPAPIVLDLITRCSSDHVEPEYDPLDLVA